MAQHGVRLLLLVAEKQEWCLPGLLLWFTLLPSGLEQLLVQAVLGYQSVMEAFGRISSSTCPSPRYSHLEIWTLPSPSFLSVHRCLGVASGVRCIRDACFAWFNNGYMFYERLLANFTYFPRVVHSDPWCSSPFRRMEKCAQLMLRVAVSLRAVRTLNLDIISASFPCDGVG